MKSFFGSRRTYLDWAAANPPSASAQRAFDQALRVFGNPHSPHTEGREARALLESARTSIAELAEVKPDAVIFTGSATEANALGIVGFVEALRATGRAYDAMHILYDAGAHSSVVENIALFSSRGVRTEALVYTNGEIDLSVLAARVQPDTVLTVVSAVCGETGAVTAVRDIRRALDKAHSGIALLVDASQLPYTQSFQLTRLGADMLTLDAQKVGGVRGIGALISPRRVSLAPLYEGGGQERGLRSGTPAHALASAFACALTDAHRNRAQFLSRALELRALFLQHIQTLPYMEVNKGREQAPHIINISLRGRDTDYLVVLLDAAGFAVSTKSSCETDSVGSRSVLVRFGDEARARATLRISFGPTTTRREVRCCARALVQAVKFVDRTGIL